MILVTGGAGYIGSHFVKLYLEKNPDASVVILDNLTTGHSKAVEALKSLFADRIQFVQGDILDKQGLKALFSTYTFTAVAHFAAMLSVDESLLIPEVYFENNVTGSLTLMNAMEEAGVRKMVFSSTCATYGNPEYFPIDENHPQKAINIYGLSKLMIEEAMRGYALAKNWSTVALRYFNVAGCDPDGVIGKAVGYTPHLVMQCLKKALNDPDVPQLRVFGNDYNTADGTCIRDYIHIQDLANAHIKALDYIASEAGQKKGFDAFNIGTGTGSSVLNIIDVTRQVTQKDIQYVIEPRRPGDSEAMICDTNKSQIVLGWEAHCSLKDTIASAWQWMQNPKY